MIIIKKHPFQLSIYLSNVNKINPSFSIWQVRRCGSAVLNLGCTLDYPESFKKKKKSAIPTTKLDHWVWGWGPGTGRLTNTILGELSIKINLRQIGYFRTWSLSGLVHSIPKESEIKQPWSFLAFLGDVKYTLWRRKKHQIQLFPGYLLVGGERTMFKVSHWNSISGLTEIKKKRVREPH